MTHMTYDALSRDEYALGRVIALINGKGGVGKTTVTAMMAVLLASQGERVLAVDLDQQGNLGDDLGYNALGWSDGGQSLSNAVQFGGAAPVILRDIRPGLDVIPGGLEMDEYAPRYLEELSGALRSRGDTEHGRMSAMLALARVLTPIAPDYSVVLLDCPPILTPLQRAALGAASYAIVPAKTDDSSLGGLAAVHGLFRSVRPVNPSLELLGVLLFGSGAKLARDEARAWVYDTLGGSAHVFKATLRHTEAVARLVRKRGQTATELVLGPETGTSAAIAKQAAGLAKDVATLVAEAMKRMLTLEAARATAVDASSPERESRPAEREEGDDA